MPFYTGFVLDFYFVPNIIIIIKPTVQIYSYVNATWYIPLKETFKFL